MLHTPHLWQEHSPSAFGAFAPGRTVLYPENGLCQMCIRDSNMYQRSELDYLIYNAPLEYADLILNGDPETYLKTVTEYKPWDS